MEIIVRKASEVEAACMLQEKLWECGITEFQWHYDNDETCLLIKGQAVVEHDEGRAVLNAGDLAVFPKGMNCVWKVSSPVVKHYR